MARPSPEQVIRGHRAALMLVRSRVVAYSRTAWAAQGSYRDADIDRLVSLIVPRVQAGQVQVANLTSAYIAQMAGLRSGNLVKAALVDRAAVTGGRGVLASEVYRRPAHVLYTALSEGVSFTDALALGSSRLVSLVSTDMQMSQVRQARSSFTSSGAHLFQRVLGGGKNCDLCVLASDQTYHIENLMPIHPGCGCGVDAIASQSAGQVIDLASLDDPSARVEVRDHGEYGPTLTNAADHFTGPGELAA